MYSSELSFGTEAPIESYLPQDVADLLNFVNDDKTNNGREYNSIDIPTTEHSFENQFGSNFSSVELSPVVTAQPFAVTPSSEWNLGWPMLTSSPQAPPNAFPTTVADLCPVVPANYEVAEVPPKMLKFVMPSGPRQTGEGTEEENQGIIDAVIIDENSLLVQMTLLVAGFVIGPSGESVRSIIAKTGATIYSYNNCFDGKECRIFYLEGTSYQILHAMEIITGAIERYKELAEGNCNGFQVDKKQHIKGVNFYYQPPPRSAVPYAASLRIYKTSKNKARSRHHQSLF